MVAHGEREAASLSHTATQDLEAAPPAVRSRQVVHLSLNFVLDMTAHGMAGLKPLESLLVMAINQANIAPLTRDPKARKRYGALEAPAQDHERRPVSVRAVAASMRLPYETARRNVRKLEERGACVTSEAGVLVPAGFMLSPAYFEMAQTANARMRDLYFHLAARDLLDPLPAANYQEAEPPVRGAVRLLSDFLLRTAEALVVRFGDLTAALAFLPMLAAAAGAEEGEPAPATVAELARRTGLPAETVRRKVATLTARGYCIAGPAGCVVSGPGLLSPGCSSLVQEHAAAVQRLFAGLAERGIVAAWEQGRAADPQNAARV
jgi:DNA-binding IclR family transcriptional regulator